MRVDQAQHVAQRIAEIWPDDVVTTTEHRALMRLFERQDVTPEMVLQARSRCFDNPHRPTAGQIHDLMFEPPAVEVEEPEEPANKESILRHIRECRAIITKERV